MCPLLDALVVLYLYLCDVVLCVFTASDDEDEGQQERNGHNSHNGHLATNSMYSVHDIRKYCDLNQFTFIFKMMRRERLRQKSRLINWSSNWMILVPKQRNSTKKNTIEYRINPWI